MLKLHSNKVTDFFGYHEAGAVVAGLVSFALGTILALKLGARARKLGATRGDLFHSTIAVLLTGLVVGGIAVALFAPKGLLSR